MNDSEITIVPQGAFSLRESVEFGFGQRHSEQFDGQMRMAFVLDGSRTQAGVVLTQLDSGAIHGAVSFADGSAAGDRDVLLAASERQVARVLSLDHDGREFDALGQRDPTIGRLLAVAPGLRPPLFYSPYEAAVWSVLSARRPARQMAQVRDALSAAQGAVFTLAGREVAALPTPEQLLGVHEFPGLPPAKLDRMHGVARAAIAGELDVDRLRELGPDGAAAAAQTLKGIGPFYASLIAIRAVGFTDVLPVEEPMVRQATARLYERGDDLTAAEFEQIAEAWRPFRTWAAVLIRAASGRVG